MAADLAAMAPQTNIGSSTPISLNGQDISKDLRRKIVNDAAAYVGELAREHDRNVVAARRMVTVASNYGAREAKRIGLVEAIAPTLPVLLEKVDGTKTVPKGLVLHTAGAQVDDVEMSFWQRARDFLVDPNLIALMLSIGLIGIVVELWNPGLIFPGTVGAISLILGLYGLQVLPVSLAGVLLMLLAAGFFVADAFLPTHGAATAAGAILFVLGALMLFDPAGDAYQVSLPVAIAIAGTHRPTTRRRPHACPAGSTQSGRGRNTGPCRRRGCRAAGGSRPGQRRALAGTHRGRLSARAGRARPDRARGGGLAAHRRIPGGPDGGGSALMTVAGIAILAVLVVVLLILFAAVKIAREYERGVIFRLGRLLPHPKGPGLFLLIPVVDRMVKVDLRTVTLNVPPQEVITKDNVPVRVNAVAYFRIVEPNAAIVQVENYMVATSQIAQTILRSILGQHVLDELLSERDKLNSMLQAQIDDQTSPWGIKVSIVEVKDVEIPASMQRAMARQAEAERERRAKVISAEGEFQASERLKDAAAVMAQEPITVQLRYLQTLLEIGAANNSTIIFPIPIDLLTALSNAAKKDGS